MKSHPAFSKSASGYPIPGVLSVTENLHSLYILGLNDVSKVIIAYSFRNNNNLEKICC